MVTRIAIAGIRRLSYHLLEMGIGGSRIIAAFTATAVLFMGINCACTVGMRISRTSDAIAMPCCMQHQGALHHCCQQDGVCRHRLPNPCGGTCQHCGQVVMNDAVAAPSHRISPGSCPSRPLPTTNLPILSSWDGHLPSSAWTRADLPPPLTSPTLLSLYCALTD